MAIGRRDSTAAARASGDRYPRPAWLIPVYGVIALMAVAALIAWLADGDNDEQKAAQAPPAQPQPAQPPPPAQPQPPQPPPATPPPGGQLTAGGQPLLPPTGLMAQIGQDASGKAVAVQSIIEGEGFWVGTSPQDRVYIEFGGAAGKTESGFRPDRPGQTVNLDGPVRAAPADPAATLKLPPADADQVKQQGAYINANSVQPAG